MPETEIKKKKAKGKAKYHLFIFYLIPFFLKKIKKL